MRIVPAVIDLVFVLLFTIIGRLTHSEGLSLGGVWGTFWPFGAACLVGWLVLGLLADDGWGMRAALIIWLVTVLGGLGLRLLAGDSAALPFVLVTTITQALMLFGWRGVAHIIRGRRSA